MPRKNPIVNVASVRQLSPFRYAGGKTWLVPEIRRWLSQNPRPSKFIELFAGGGIVGLTAAAEYLVDHVILVELDPDVAAVWKTIFHGDAEWLASRILEFDLTLEKVTETITQKPQSTAEHAFQTILRNRTLYGGILAAGSGLPKYGENGKGIASRWYPATLANRIRNLILLRGRVTFVEGDGLAYLQETLNLPYVAYYIDPPYTAPGKRAGRRLYTYSEIDHEQLFDFCKEMSGNFLMSYDDADAVIAMAEKRGFHITKVPMKGTHHIERFELLIAPTLESLPRPVHLADEAVQLTLFEAL